jgi:hypothetical protein
MRKLLAGLVSGIALLGLAACGDADDTTTQGIDQDPAMQAPADPGADGTAPPPAEPAQ